MIDIKTESIEILELMKNYEELSKKSSFDITLSRGRWTATKNLR